MTIKTSGSISEFARKVRKCRQEKSPETIDNASIAYAAILLDELFGFAKDEKATEVLILSGRLFRNVYDQLVEQIRSLLDTKCKVKVIVVESGSSIESNAFFKAVRDHENGEVLCLGKNADLERHFVVVGDIAYRLETDDKESTANACFNDQSGVVQVLKEKFSELWKTKMEGSNANGSDHCSRA